MPNAVCALIDHCVIMHGKTTRLVAVTETIDWGHTTAPIKVTRLQGKRLGEGETWLRNERRSIAALGMAARQGSLRPYTSMELGAERLKARMKGSGIRGDLWNHVRFEHVPVPLDRSTWMGSRTLEQVASREDQRAFYLRLLKFAREGVPQALLDALPETEFIGHQKRHLARLSEFAAICTTVGEARHGDAFHYWTALCGNLDYFVTTDKAFLDALRQHPDPDLVCQAVSPSELVELMDLLPMDLPISEGEIAAFSTD